MPGYGPSSSKDRLCIWVVFASFFVAGLPTEKFQPLLVDRHSLCKNVLCLKSLFNSLTVICFHLPCQVVSSSLALAPQTWGGGEKVVTATACGDVRICAVAMLKYILTIDWPKVSGPH